MYRVASLFSGAGGMDLGFKNAGFDVVWANDFDRDSVQTYNSNIGNHSVLGDITKIQSSEIPDDIDLVLGGFPCQGFSVNNTKRSMDDERNSLYLEMLRIVADKKPKFFLAENVKGILSIGGKPLEVINMIKNDFMEIGYEVDYQLINTADYGIPQLRQRVFIMGNRIGVKNKFPEKTHMNFSEEHQDQLRNNPLYKECFGDLKPYIPAKDVIGHLDDIRIRDLPFELDGKTIYNHTASTNVADEFWGRKYKVNQHDICDYLKKWRNKSGWSTKRVDMHFGYAHTAGHWFRKDNNSGSIPKPDDWWELKKILKFDDTYDKEVTTFVKKKINFEQTLRIANWDRPSDTITASGAEIHPNKKRRLSVRESAIIQTFPDDFIFHGRVGSCYKQIGNAVPVKMAELFGNIIYKQITDEVG